MTQTRGSWVRSVYAASVLLCPRRQLDIIFALSLNYAFLIMTLLSSCSSLVKLLIQEAMLRQLWLQNSLLVPLNPFLLERLILSFNFNIFVYVSNCQ